MQVSLLKELTIGGMRGLNDESREALILTTVKILELNPALIRLDLYRLTKTPEEAMSIIKVLLASSIDSLEALSLGWNPEWWQT